MIELDNLELNDTIGYEVITHKVDQATVTLELKGNIITENGDELKGENITPDLINKILDFDGYEPIFGESILIVRYDKGFKTFLCSDNGLVLIYEYID